MATAASKHGRVVEDLIRDSLAACVALAAAFLLRFDTHLPPGFPGTLAACCAVAVAGLLVSGFRLRLFGTISRYASVEEMIKLAGAVGFSTAALLVASLVQYAVNGHRPLPLSVPLIWAPMAYLLLSTFRVAPRVLTHLQALRSPPPDGDRVLVVGAGNAGEQVVREMLSNPDAKYVPVGFVDEDPATHGRRIHGLPVLGAVADLADIAASKFADQVVIALPNAPSRVVRQVLNCAAEAGLTAKILPSLGERLGSPATLTDVRGIDICDLISRSQVRVDFRQIAEIFQDRTVLVTGAAGSIGSELARQALYFRPSRLILLDNNESDLFTLTERLAGLARSRGAELEMVIADVRDRRRVDVIFDQYRPKLVFHAAAYKHVPIMEKHPAEAVTVNVTGTRNVAEASVVYRVERFVLVSTDKAVKPASVMGATKKAAEMVIAQAGSSGSTVFCSVRFGNVMGSRGSVVPIFARQIAAGGPITVTHPDATRYFMTIEEAVALICQAGALGKGGETFVLEMGEPVRILELAERMRTLLGKEHEDDIEIVISGLRRGEKLHEDLWNPDETLIPVQDGIMKARREVAEQAKDWEPILHLEHLAAQHWDPDLIVKTLFDLVASSEPGAPASLDMLMPHST